MVILAALLAGAVEHRAIGKNDRGQRTCLPPGLNRQRLYVIPAKGGIQDPTASALLWTPAFAGVTDLPLPRRRKRANVGWWNSANSREEDLCRS